MLADIVDIADHIVVPEPQDGPAIFFQTSRPQCISLGNTAIAMLRTVDLDDKPFLRASEVDDIARYRKLPTETKSHQPVCAKLVPEFQFGISHDATHRFRIGAMSRR